MERFTEKLPDGRCILKEYMKVHSTKYGDFIEGDAVEKLAEYEDLEEHGLLLRLPCKEGDTIYEIYSDGEYCVSWRDIKEEKFTLSYYEHHKADFDKTVFLTKAEAEAALK